MNSKEANYIRMINAQRTVYAANINGSKKIVLPKTYCKLLDINDGDVVEIIVKKVNK